MRWAAETASIGLMVVGGSGKLEVGLAYNDVVLMG